MAKFGGLKLTNQTNFDKIMYKDFMVGKTDELNYAGKTWREKSMSSKRPKAKKEWIILYLYIEP